MRALFLASILLVSSTSLAQDTAEYPAPDCGVGGSEAPEGKGSCTCASPGSPGVALGLLALGALAVRRRAP